MPENRLANETSPYLLQHKTNPVDWRPWGPEALALAAQSDRPILLSVGYAACHWCHVMAHESFEDPETAALMNNLFVNIKLDREERPDLDAIYQSALALLGEQGGWPLTMFLTPTAEPFWGGTYYPPTSRFGRPGFKDVLKVMAAAYRDDRDRVMRNVNTLGDALRALAQPRPGGSVDLALTDRIAQRLCREVDPFHGGIGSAPKFPQPTIFELLWRAWKRTGEAPFRRAVLVTLEAMCQGGIYDHLGGGFARYSTDEHWLVPHFEKMLYDNAQLVSLLTLVWQETRSPLFAERVAETIDWLLREMAVDGGGFAGTLDADSEGEEGRFYVWTADEIDAVLGAAAGPFKAAYDATPLGNWEGKTILHRRHAGATDEAADAARLAAARKILLEARSRRVRPGRDDKVLADWNGLAIAALANAALTFASERPTEQWLSAAVRAFAFVRDKLTVEGRLRHSWCAGHANHPATIDDYANMTRAALALFEATGEAAYLAQAERWIDLADQHYWDHEAGGYFLAAADTDDLIARSKTAADNAVPAGNGTLVGALARLYYLTGKDAYRLRAEQVVANFTGEISRNFYPLATLLNGNELLQAAVQIVIVGAREAPETLDLLRAVNGVCVPNKVLTVIALEHDLPADHPAAGKGQVQGRATAYVCRGTTCTLPLTEPQALAAELAGAT
jgi:uncharacterized protein YyaL (SSP411 family)